MKIRVFNQEGEAEFLGEDAASVFYKFPNGIKRSLPKQDKGISWNFVSPPVPVVPIPPVPEPEVPSEPEVSSEPTEPTDEKEEAPSVDDVSTPDENQESQ